MNNELLLEWCILNNPGVKQDVFPNDTNLSDKYTTEEDDKNYSYNGVKERELQNAADLDTNLGTTTHAVKSKQYVSTNSKKKNKDNDSKGMKQNDLKFGSDWINPKIAKTFFEMYEDGDEIHAKKLLKYAWLQGRLDNNNFSMLKDQSNPADANGNLNNITRYIQTLRSAADLNRVTNTNVYTDEDLAYIHSFIVDGTQRFNLNALDDKGHFIKDANKNAINNRTLLSKKVLDVLISFPPWQKEFILAYSRIKGEIENVLENGKTKLYRGLYLKDANILYNKNIYTSNKMLYNVLQNDYNSTTTDIAKAMYFALSPTEKRIDHHSVILSFNANKNVFNIPYTMYLNGKNGKYSESEINILRDNELKNITDVELYIGPKAINNKFLQVINDNANLPTIAVRDGSNKKNRYNIRYTTKSIHLFKAENSKPMERFNIIDRYENVPEITEQFKHAYYTLILATDSSNTIRLFLLDKFGNEMCECSIATNISKERIKTRFKELKLQYYVNNDNPEKLSLKVLGPSERGNGLANYASVAFTYDYNYIQHEEADIEYQENIKDAFTAMIVNMVNNNEVVATILKQRAKTLFNFDEDEFEQIINNAKEEKRKDDDAKAAAAKAAEEAELEKQKQDALDEKNKNIKSLIDTCANECKNIFRNKKIPEDCYKYDINTSSADELSYSLTETIYYKIVDHYVKVNTNISEYTTIATPIRNLFTAELASFAQSTELPYTTPKKIQEKIVTYLNNKNNSKYKTALVSVLFNIPPYKQAPLTGRPTDDNRIIATNKNNENMYNKNIEIAALELGKKLLEEPAKFEAKLEELKIEKSKNIENLIKIEENNTADKILDFYNENIFPLLDTLELEIAKL